MAEEKKKKRFLFHIWEAVKGYLYIPITVVVCWVLFGCILVYGVVPSASMEPTCDAGSIFLGTRMSYKWGNVERGDVVLFHFEDSIFVKRVIGLSGETVTISSGKVYIDGEVLDESDYLAADVYTDSETIEFEVPSDSLFVLGDNRSNSFDSRYWKYPFVPVSDLIGQYWSSMAIPFLESR